ncbi:unnamed protein product [Allacma fusca]|uniref:Uncharacterized protein n=1 Tax=Allacma fusca TaxID=39272 RepID=A0A8J2NYY5_9HEXA|nr:unnamed protein product [Allacma fusca]
METYADIMNYKQVSYSGRVGNGGVQNVLPATSNNSSSIRMGNSSQEQIKSSRSNQNKQLLQSRKASQQLVPEVSPKPRNSTKELTNKDPPAKKYLPSNSPIATGKRSSKTLAEKSKNHSPTTPLGSSLNSKPVSNTVFLQPQSLQESGNAPPTKSVGSVNKLDILKAVPSSTPEAKELSPSQSLSVKSQKQSKKSLAVNFTTTQSKYKAKVDTWNRHDVMNHKKIKDNLLMKQKIFESRDYLLETSSKHRSQSGTIRKARIEGIMARPKSPSQNLQLPKQKITLQNILPLKPKTPPLISQKPKKKGNKYQVAPPTPASQKTPKSVTTVHSDDVSVKTEDITFEYDDDPTGSLKTNCPVKDSSKNCLEQNQNVTLNKDLLLPDSRTRLVSRGLVITTKSYETTDWTMPIDSLTIEKCVYFLTPDNLKLAGETLKHIKFSYLTSFQNIDTVLRNCSNLTKLSFSNVIVVQKKLFKPEEHSPIQLPRLKSLEVVEWNRRLTKYESIRCD